MNYIELNGVRSNSITGLLVQSLPPISKPLIRTEIEEIDGRDGDIVTKLGYSAYDKEIEIGLRGNFDINEVIAFFDSEGVVTFSNEPDKFYHYQIIEQIDFEKLVRFRTAKVTFHVQPFKYPISETPVTEDAELMVIDDCQDSDSGISLNVQNGLITLHGTATANAEFDVPVSIDLSAGDYLLYAITRGTQVSGSSVALDSGGYSFGGGALTLQENSIALASDTLSSSKRFDTVSVMVESGHTVDFSFFLVLVNSSVQTLTVTNQGNTISKPRITIVGGGTINLSLNGQQIFIINLGNEGQITIDSAQMEASNGGILKNRLVAGDYDDLVLNVGSNTLSWTGGVSEIMVENYTRWI